MNFTIISGDPGTGKTAIAHALRMSATPAHPPGLSPAPSLPPIFTVDTFEELKTILSASPPPKAGVDNIFIVCDGFLARSDAGTLNYEIGDMRRPGDTFYFIQTERHPS